MTREYNRGYTLIEVLLILFLILILVNGVAPRFFSSEAWTRSKADSSNRLRIEGAVELYKLDTGTIPATLDDLMIQPPELTRWRGPYLERIPENPSKGAVPYQLDSQGKVIVQ